MGKWAPASAGKAKAGLIPLADEMQGVQITLRYPLEMHAIPKRLRHVSCIGTIHIDITFTYQLHFTQVVMCFWQLYTIIRGVNLIEGNITNFTAHAVFYILKCGCRGGLTPVCPCPSLCQVISPFNCQGFYSQLSLEPMTFRLSAVYKFLFKCLI